VSTWHPIPAPVGWRKGDFDMRIVHCPRTKKLDFVGTWPKGAKKPKERAGRRWRTLVCACGQKRTIVAWKNERARRLYSIDVIAWGERHAGCGKRGRTA
jgi:hypothetical protein